MAWTDEATETAISLWEKGCSAGVIALHLNGKFTRNAIMGKLFRLGYKREATQKVRPLRVTIPKPKPKPPVINVDPPVKTENGYITLADLKDGMCKWPIGDPQHDDFHFCGRPSVEHRPYCEGHRAAAYRPNTKGRGVVGGGE